MKSTRLTSRMGARSLGLLALAAVLALASGCVRTGSVSGQVRLNGVPLHGGVVTFIGPDGEQKVANIGSEGEYRVDGLPADTVKITVTNLGTNVSMPMTRSAVMKDTHGLPQPPSTQSALPRKYANPDNGLTLTVTKGKQTFDIDLTP
jgi:hypothetical protein